MLHEDPSERNRSVLCVRLGRKSSEKMYVKYLVNKGIFERSARKIFRANLRLPYSLSNRLLLYPKVVPSRRDHPADQIVYTH
jgi:hypothetical protein